LTFGFAELPSARWADGLSRFARLPEGVVVLVDGVAVGVDDLDDGADVVGKVVVELGVGGLAVLGDGEVHEADAGVDTGDEPVDADAVGGLVAVFIDVFGDDVVAIVDEAAVDGAFGVADGCEDAAAEVVVGVVGADAAFGVGEEGEVAGGGVVVGVFVAGDVAPGDAAGGVGIGLLDDVFVGADGGRGLAAALAVEVQRPGAKALLPPRYSKAPMPVRFSRIWAPFSTALNRPATLLGSPGGMASASGV